MVFRSKKLVKVSLAEVVSPSETEADTKAGAIASDASWAILKNVFPSHSDIAIEAEAPQHILQGADPLVLVLGFAFDKRQCRFRFCGVGGGLVCQTLRLGGGLLGLSCRRLGLFGTALHLPSGGIGLLGYIQQLLQLGLQLVHLPVLLLQLLLLRGQGLAKLLDLFGADPPLIGFL